MANCFPPENDHHHTEVVGKTLVLVAPGLGRALVGNYWKGTILYFVCFALVKGFEMSETESFLVPERYWPLLGLFSIFFAKLLIWGLFLQNDWAFVNKALKPMETVPLPAEALSSEQSSG